MTSGPSPNVSDASFGATATSAGTSDQLARYAAYRRRQAHRLVHMLPRDAVRPLYRTARAELGADAAPDPMTLLVLYCERLLPLPPFDVWLRDAETHPARYLSELDESPQSPTAAAPLTIETRRLQLSGSSVLVRLRAFRDTSSWRGFLSFGEPKTRVVHTGVIFREADPAALRERFLGFDRRSLEAFFRSASA